MRLELSKDVYHKANEKYYCLLVHFEPEKDMHFFKKASNWMPKTDELKAITQLLLAVDPDFRGWLLRYVKSFEVN